MSDDDRLEQARLRGIPPTLRQWLDDAFARTKDQATGGWELSEHRKALFFDVPRGFLPVVERLHWTWWVKVYAQYCHATGLALVKGLNLVTEGDKLDVPTMVYVQREMPLEQFRDWELDKMRRLRVGIEAIRGEVADWEAENKFGLDVDRFVDELRNAAGL